jgi:hypothetical protein
MKRCKWDLEAALALAALATGCGGVELSISEDASAPDAGIPGGGDASYGGDSSVDASAPPGDSSVGDSPSSSDASSLDSGPCGPGEHLCSGTCYPNDVQHCGPSCVACGAPANGTATCDGTSCGYTCNALECGTTCVDPTTDEHNCGACGHDCAGETCQNSLCQPVVITSLATSFVINDIAVDANNVYWTVGQGGSSVFQTALVGGTTIPLTTTSNDPQFLALDATSVYWTDCAGSLDKAPIGGGAIKTLATDPLCLGYVAVDSGTAYFTGSKGLESVPADGSGTAGAVAEGALGFALDANNLYWTTWDGTTYSDVYQLPRGADAAAATRIATSVLGELSGIAVAGTNVFVSDGYHVESLPVGGGALITLSSGSGGAGIVTDGTNIYWADPRNVNGILRVSTGGGPVTTLASAAPGTVGYYIAVDSTYVYFYAHDQQGNWTIYKVPK